MDDYQGNIFTLKLKYSNLFLHKETTLEMCGSE